MQRLSNRTYLLLGLALVTLQVVVLYLINQPLICTCDYVKIWEGVVLSSGNSQHLTDWYTFSHVIHGFLFYLLLWYFFPRMPIAMRFVLAIGIEVGWELFENTPMVIDHYRQQALAQGYVGDSIINSVCDTLAMVLGFVLALRWPTWSIIGLGVAFELFVGFSIRDNLTLNTLNLVYQFPLISEWQAGG